MKSSVALVAAAAAVAYATPQAVPSSVKINCAKPNANFCIGDSVILRCDASGTGTREMCAPELPLKADDARCVQSSQDAGDAVCKKPSGSAPTTTGVVSIPEGTATTHTSAPSATGTASIPEGSSTGISSSGAGPSPSGTTATETQPSTQSAVPTVTLSTSIVPGNSSTIISSILTNPIRTSEQPGATGTDKPAASTTATHTGPTGAAAANQAAGALAALGMIAAYFI